ncbi:hypothetical protein HY480_01565 [Candidatus Uhrbacteria bacterium]|nr:hypothetical protein [Candidatus Uhrbacteria bacterium]
MQTSGEMSRATRVKDPIPTALTLFGVEEKRKRSPSTALTEQLRRAQEFRQTAPSMLLPIEQPAALRVLDRQIAVLKGESLGFQRIPLDKLRRVLGWRNDDGMPTLAPFSVERDTFEFRIDQWNRGGINVGLPPPLGRCYDDVYALLRKRKNGRGNVEIRATARFDGVIPDDVRRMIVGVKEQLKDIRILAEVEHWKIKETELPMLNADPLVIGYDGEEFWLLAAFDITPLEEAVRQICLGKEPTGS